MISLIRHELLKLCCKRLVIIVAAMLVLCNGFLYWKQQSDRNADLLQHLNEFRQIEHHYKALSFEEAFRLIRETRDKLKDFLILLDAAMYPDHLVFQQRLQELKETSPDVLQEFGESEYPDNPGLLRRHMFIYEQLLSQYRAVKENADYIDELRTRADGMLSVSIFQDRDSFAYRNIRKTASDFEHLKNVPLEPGLETGIVTSATFAASDLFLALLILMTGYCLFFSEKENNLINLIAASKHGRAHTAFAKLAAMAVAVAFLVLALYGTTIVMANLLYGTDSLSIHVRSMPFFKYSNLNITVLDYYLLFLACKYLAGVLSAFAIACLYIVMDQPGKVYLSVVAWIGFSWLAYAYIHPSSMLNLVKYVNIVAFMHTGSLLGEYRNINFFGFPVNAVPLFAAACATGILLFALFAVYSFASRRPIGAGNRRPFFGTILRRTAKNRRMSGGLLAHEMFKSGYAAKGYLVFLLALVVGVSGIRFEEFRFNFEEAAYNEYLSVLSGPLNEENIRRIQQEKTRFDTMPDRSRENWLAYNSGEISIAEYNEREAEIKLLMLKQKAFNRVYEQYNHLMDLKHAKGIDGSFINEISSDYLFNNKTRDLANGLIFTVLLIAALSPLFPVEYRSGMIAVARAARHGRMKWFAAKHAVGFMYATAMFVMMHAPQYINLVKDYNPIEWNAPVQSIRRFGHVEGDWSVLEFVILLNLLQLFGVMLMAVVLLCLSAALRRTAVAIIADSVLFVLPVVFAYAGRDFLDAYSFNNILLLFHYWSEHHGIGEMMLYYLALTGLAAVCAVLGWLRFSGKRIRLRT